MVKVEKTELRREPTHSDSAILSSDSAILLAEIQTTKNSRAPWRLREFHCMPNYYVGFKRQNPRRRVQAPIALKETRLTVPCRARWAVCGMIRAWYIKFSMRAICSKNRSYTMIFAEGCAKRLAAGLAARAVIDYGPA
jgi:hypothetical protein